MATYNSLTSRSDVGEGTGRLIPEGEVNEILKSLPAQSAALQLGRQVRLSTRVTRQPVLSTLPAAYWVSTDSGLKETTEAAWDSKYLTAEELAVIVPIPENVLADSAYDIIGEYRPLIVEAIAAKLDDAVLFGENAPSSWEDAIVPGAISAGNSLGGGAVDVAADVNNVMAKVEADGFTVNGFAARTGLKASLRGLRDDNNGLLFQPSLTAGTPATLYGEPIAYSDGTGVWDAGIDLIAGDWSKLVIGVRQDISFKLFTEGVVSDGSGNVVLNLMQQDSVALRITARYAYSVANPINRLNTDANTRYPFAVLENSTS